MKASTYIGIGITLLLIALGATLEGTNLMAVFNVPALCVVVGGTLGVTIAAVGLQKVLLVPKLYIRVLNGGPPDYAGQVDQLVDLADRARKEGLLALDEMTGSIEDPFLRKGMQLVVDGTDPEIVREILEAELDGMAARHKAGAQPFVQAGGFAPTLGILGTVMGLVHVLENLDKPETLGHSIAGAFIATLYGVGSANVVFLPIANRLKVCSAQEQEVKTMVIEGVLAVQAGDNPRIVADRLMTFVPPEQREREDAPAADADGPVLAEAA